MNVFPLGPQSEEEDGAGAQEQDQGVWLSLPLLTFDPDGDDHVGLCGAPGSPVCPAVRSFPVTSLGVWLVAGCGTGALVLSRRRPLVLTPRAVTATARAAVLRR